MLRDFRRALPASHRARRPEYRPIQVSAAPTADHAVGDNSGAMPGVLTGRNPVDERCHELPLSIQSIDSTIVRSASSHPFIASETPFVELEGTVAVKNHWTTPLVAPLMSVRTRKPLSASRLEPCPLPSCGSPSLSLFPTIVIASGPRAHRPSMSRDASATQGGRQLVSAKAYHTHKLAGRYAPEQSKLITGSTFSTYREHPLEMAQLT